MRNTHNKNEIELELKDKKAGRLLAEVTQLEKCVLLSTIGLRKIKLQITNQLLCTQKTLKMLQLFQAENMGLKRAISQLGDLRRVNEKQKKQILELTYCREDYEELVLLVRQAETKNQYLKRMVYDKAFPVTPVRYLGNSPRVLRRRYPGTPSGLRFKPSKPLNPKANCFTSMSPRHHISRSQIEDEKGLLKEQKGIHNQKQKSVKKDSFFAAEMKRKFAEACREDNTSSSEILVNVKLNVVLEKDKNVAVKAVLYVTVTNASSRSDKAKLIVDKQTKSSSSFLQVVVPPLADVPHHHQSSPFSSSAFSPTGGRCFSFSPHTLHASMNWPIVDDQKLDFPQAKLRKKGEGRALTVLSAKNGGNTNHTFNSHKLSPEAKVVTELSFTGYPAAVGYKNMMRM